MDTGQSWNIISSVGGNTAEENVLLLWTCIAEREKLHEKEIIAGITSGQRRRGETEDTLGRRYCCEDRNYYSSSSMRTGIKGDSLRQSVADGTSWQVVVVHEAANCWMAEDKTSHRVRCERLECYSAHEMESRDTHLRFVFQHLPEPNRACLVGVYAVTLDPLLSLYGIP